MTSLEEIRKLLKQFTAGVIQVIPADVVSVDESDMTCIVTPDDGLELKARLKSAVDTKEGRFVLIPAIKSTVLVGFINNQIESAFITSYGELTKLYCKIGDQTMEMTAEGMAFNGGKNGGLIVHEQLLNEYKKTSQLLQKIVDIVNGSPIPEPGAGAVSALQAALKAAILEESIGSFEEITNDKVTH